MSPEITPSETELDLGGPEKDRERRRRIIIALLFLLLSFVCIFCSSQSALWLIDRSRIDANMLSSLRADYGEDISLDLAPLEGDIAAEAEHDEALLLARQTPIAGGLGVVILPNPIPTPAPTVIALLPTPTPAPSNPPDSEPSTPIPVAPTPTTAPPTSSPPTAPPPTSPPPTGAPPTVPPTVPPTAVPPTVPPPTVPPTAVPPTVPPTGVPPTGTSTGVPPTASPTLPPPTDTPTATPTPPTVNFSAAAFGVNEIGVNAVITVTLSGTSPQTVTVNFASVAGGTATEGVDYTPVNGVLTFAPGQTSQTFNIPIIDDIIAGEGNETVLLALTNPVNANPGLMNATLTITDNDFPPAVQFSDLTYNVGEGDGSATITVILVNTTSALSVTVNYTTADGSATNGSDYTGVSNTLTFAPGTTSLTFTVSITDDTLFEGPDPETVNLALSGPTNAALGTPDQATLNITDNDLVPPTVSFNAPPYTVAENVAGGVIQIPVELSFAAGVTITVDYAAADQTATAGSDYTATNGTLTFPPGVTDQNFSVTVLDEIPPLDEPDEIIRLTLSNPNPGGVTLGAPNPTTLMILDNDNAGTCPGDYTDPDEPNIGTPDGDFARIECGVAMIIDLGSTTIETGHFGFDLTYYEVQGVGGPPPTFPTIYYIYMDLVQIQISQAPAGPWYTVFEWGDNIIDTNTNIGGTYADTGPGVDNMLMYGPPYGPLIGPGDPYYNTGVAIDIDNLPAVLPVVPSGTYRYIRIFSPSTGDTDGPEVDAIQVCLPGDCPYP